MTSRTVFLALALSTALSTPLESAKVTFYVRHQEANRAVLEKTFHEVSNPQHERYRKHLSHAEVLRLQTPHPDHIAMVESHLFSIGATVGTRKIRSPN